MLSEKAKSIEASPTLALAAQAKALKDEGKDVISLTVGEPDWNSFESAVSAGIKAIQNGQTKYMPAGGFPDLKKAIAEDYNSKFKTQYKPDQVSVSAGAKFILVSAMQTVLDPGDEVIIPSPYWVSYPEMAKMMGAVPVCISCDEDSQFKLTPELLESAITSKTKMLVLNSPSNPTGMEYQLDELKALAQVLRKHPKIVILSDDIYNVLSFQERGVSPHLLEVAPDLIDRCICVNGASKAFSMTGWRIGWALAPKDVIKAMSDYQSQTVSCAPSFAQIASLAALKAGSSEVSQAVDLLKGRRDRAVAKILKVKGLDIVAPQGAFYLWLNVKSFLPSKQGKLEIKNSDEFAKELLSKKLVASVPGSAFGLEGYLRLSYALAEDKLMEAIDRIADFVSELDSSSL